MTLYGIWCKDVGERSNNMGGWMRENSFNHLNPILAFESKGQAQKRAAEHYGFATYTEAKRKEWCEVRSLSSTPPRENTDEQSESSYKHKLAFLRLTREVRRLLAENASLTVEVERLKEKAG